MSSILAMRRDRIDKVNSVCQIDNENDNAEASKVTARLRTIRNAAGSDATIVLDKHLGKNGIRGAKE